MGTLHDLASEALPTLVKGLIQEFLLKKPFNRYSAVMTRLVDILDWGRSLIWPMKPFLLLLKGLGQDFLLKTNLGKYVFCGVLT